MKELKRCQIMRRIERQDADQQRDPSPSLRDEAATRPAEKKVDLKKQSQFVPAQVGAKSFMKGDYDKKPAGGVEKNKANQTQLHAPAQGKGAGKIEKSVAAASG
ncbi:MAG: hypothetical protein WBC05_20130 [Sedimentisphaerales bacterium]